MYNIVTFPIAGHNIRLYGDIAKRSVTNGTNQRPTAIISSTAVLEIGVTGHTRVCISLLRLGNFFYILNVDSCALLKRHVKN